MSSAHSVGRIAIYSLVGAAVLVAVGRLLDRPERLPFLGGLLAAFGEAALVGGLADWFAVRALFAHPLGLPFPHTALIPHNQRRISREIRVLVETEWLPRSMIVARVNGIDFVGRFLPVLAAFRAQLHELLRDVLRRALEGLDADALAHRLAGAAGAAMPAERASGLLADVVAQARQRRWLTPVVHDLVVHLERWAAQPGSRLMIRSKLELAADAYRKGGAWKDLALSLGEIFGGVDLDHAAWTLQQELQRFAREQQAEGGQMHAWLDGALRDLERRLRQDPGMAADVGFILGDSEGLADLLSRLITQLRGVLLGRLDDANEPWTAALLERTDAWVRQLSDDPVRREEVNAWARRVVAQLVEEHHGLIGTLVEEQMGRLSGEELSALIQSRVGEDLNWIRLNGTFVGGLIGVAIYLAVALLRALG